MGKDGDGDVPDDTHTHTQVFVADVLHRGAPARRLRGRRPRPVQERPRRGRRRRLAAVCDRTAPSNADS